MQKLLLVSAILALLFTSIVGLLPLKHVPHEHILIGSVTPEQLRAHLAAEARDVETTPNLPAPALINGLTVTPTGGVILSAAPANVALPTILQLEMALQFSLLFFIPCIHYSFSIGRLVWQTLEPVSPDPPPRLSAAPA